MRGAPVARIVGPEGHLDQVQHAVIDPAVGDDIAGGFIHRQRDPGGIVLRGHDQVGPRDQALLIRLIMMNECSPGSLHHPDSLARGLLRNLAHGGTEDLRVGGQLLHPLGRIEQLNETGPVHGQCMVDRFAAQGVVKPFVCLLRQGRGHPVCGVQPRQGRHGEDAAVRPIFKAGPPDVFQVTELDITPRFNMFGDVIQIGVAGEFCILLSLRIDNPQQAIVEVDLIIVVGQPHVVCPMGVGIRGDILHVLRVFQHDIIKDLQAELGKFDRMPGRVNEVRLIVCGQRLGNPAGQAKDRVNRLSGNTRHQIAQLFADPDDFLPDFQSHFAQHPEDVAFRLGRLWPDDKVRSAQKEEVQCMIFDHENIIDMCIFPKDYVYNQNEPEYYPFEGEPLKNWDFTRFNPEFWQHFEKRVLDLLKMGIEADIILFHTYDRWDFEYMDKESDDHYIRYAVARLSAFRNVWWSLANEFDFMPDKKEADWDRFFQIIQKHDPYQHLRGIHNGSRWYDHNKPWVTHASIQTSDMAAGIRFREDFQKPVIYDECKYEGNIPHGWGQLTPEKMVEYFWKGTLSGCYVGHGETYFHPEDLLWWAKGGVLRGKSPARIAFLKNFMSKAPNFEELMPMGDDKGNYVLGMPGKYYLAYGRSSGNTSIKLAGDMPYKIDAIDTWHMKEIPYGTAQPGEYTFASPQENMVYRFTPYAPGEKIRPEAVASADVINSTAPLTINFSSSNNMKCYWDFGDGSTSQEPNPTYVFQEFGRYLVTLTVTDDDGLSASTALAVTVLPQAPTDLNKFSTWPGSKSDMQFIWQNNEDSNTIESRDEAKISDAGEMVIGKGAFVAREINDKLLNACQKTNQVTIEGVITITNMDQAGPARIISFSKDSNRRNFTLGQQDKNIVMRLRTPRTGLNGLSPQVTVCQITPNESMHIVISYYPGNLYCYLNGKLVYQGSDVRGDFSNWESCFLIFGDEYNGGRNWIGKISNVSIYNRFIGPEEAGHKYKLLKTE